MWFWVIRVFWKEGSEESDGLYSVPVPTDSEDVLSYDGLAVFNTEEEARTFIEERLVGVRREPTPLRPKHILKTVESDADGTPNRIFYLGGYRKGDQTGAPLTSAQFRAAIEGNAGET